MDVKVNIVNTPTEIAMVSMAKVVTQKELSEQAIFGSLIGGPAVK